MASIISAGTTSGTALNMSGDTSGVLQLATNGTTTAITIDTSQRAAFVAGTAALPAITTTGDTNTGIFFPAADTIAFSEGGAESMRIDSSGKLLVNTTSDVVGNSPAFIVNGTGFSNGSEFRWTGTNSFYNVMVANGNGFLGGINTNGSTTTYTNLSDYRVKENIEPMQNALGKISLLKPCTFTYKTNGIDGQGFIAHELQEVFPDAVVGEKDEIDKDGNPKYQGIDTSFLVATLTAAIQELKALNDTQAATITALTARIVALETV